MIEIIAYEKPNTSQGRSLSSRLDLTLAWPVPLRNLTYTLTSPVAFEPYGTHMEGRHRATEMAMGWEEVGKGGERSYRTDHKP